MKPNTFFNPKYGNANPWKPQNPICYYSHFSSTPIPNFGKLSNTGRIILFKLQLYQISYLYDVWKRQKEAYEWVSYNFISRFHNLRRILLFSDLLQLDLVLVKKKKKNIFHTFSIHCKGLSVHVYLGYFSKAELHSIAENVQWRN